MAVNRIELMHEALKKKRAEGVIVRLDLIEKAKRKPTYANCVKAMCWQCMHDDYETAKATRDRIRTCPSEKTCPIHPVRPFRK